MLEIERKWLVDVKNIPAKYLLSWTTKDPAFAIAESTILFMKHIQQCYSDVEGIPARVRSQNVLHLVDGTFKQEHESFLTQKTLLEEGGNLVRKEIELPIPNRWAYRILDEDATVVLHKTRTGIPCGNFVIELDHLLLLKDNRFGVKGCTKLDFYMAEVEFKSIEDALAFEAPGWFGLEVTEDKRYGNQSITYNGLPKE
jgi:CYTH domain-containing protein